MNPLVRLHRAARVGRTAATIYGLYKTDSLGRRLLRLPPRKDRNELHERAARIILNTALDLRGVLIKVCQVIGTRSDVFPPPFITILKQCHDRVPPRPYEVMRDAVEHELGKPLDAVFSEFSREPVASASLAQVHRARLNDGRPVAVKVQYPDIEEIVRTDLANVRRVCRIYERLDPQ
ncbi:MAG: AarF/UbiB family protein, partial [Vicinamibacteria bacterium]